jgi:hypothetical protein
MATNTRDLWAKRVERWKDSGLTAKEFAAEMGINPQTLAYWRWRLKAEEAEKPTKKAGRKKHAPVEEPPSAPADCANGAVPAVLPRPVRPPCAGLSASALCRAAGCYGPGHG